MDNSKKIILDLCGGSGSWSQPYKDAGYDVRLITLPLYDVRMYEPPANVYGILAAPPCTEFSIAKDHNLPRDIEGGMEIVKACMRIIEKAKPVFYAIENPIGKLASFIGKPTMSFQPFEYGDGWTKRTMLWGNFVKPVKKYSRYTEVEPIAGAYIRPGRKTVSIAFNHLHTHGKLFTQLQPYLEYCEKFPYRENDAAFRAITPPGFAKAFFEANA